jgi:hypothetical protein
VGNADEIVEKGSELMNRGGRCTGERIYELSEASGVGFTLPESPVV